jgi:3-oxoacyl-[acyl-carrier protein] reductase
MMTSQGRLANRTAIVTGSGLGIGAAIARLFAAEGARVVVNARSSEHVAGVVKSILDSGGQAQGVPADLGSLEGVAALVDGALGHYGSLDILVHNAGIFPYNKLEHMDDETWQKVMDVNLTSGYRLSKACLPHLKQSDAGRILFTSSVNGNHAAVPGTSHYATSKAGLTGLIRSAALEFARYNITVNGVEPGLVLTEGTEQAIPADQREAMAASVPLRRWGLPDEVAQAMLFLASDGASYITGQSLLMDGGASLPIFGG